MNYEEYWNSHQKILTETDPLIESKAKIIRTAYQNISQPQILDAGCGAGALICAYNAPQCQITAIDISKAAIDLLNDKLLDNVRAINAELEKKWELPDQHFDLIVSSEVIEHLINFPIYLQEAYRVLKPGGKLILTTPYHGLLKNLLLCFFAFDKHFCNYKVGHIRFFTNKNLKHVVSQCGFRNIKFKGLGRFPFLSKSIVLTAEKC